MLSYRHGFHAGNHADVLKHIALVMLLRILTRKEKPVTVVDTHAGAGMYSLERGFAVRHAEFRNGIGVLWARNDLPEPVADYVNLVRAVNADGVLRHYRGHPGLRGRCSGHRTACGCSNCTAPRRRRSPSSLPGPGAA